MIFCECEVINNLISTEKMMNLIKIVFKAEQHNQRLGQLFYKLVEEERLFLLNKLDRVRLFAESMAADTETYSLCLQVTKEQCDLLVAIVEKINTLDVNQLLVLANEAPIAGMALSAFPSVIKLVPLQSFFFYPVLWPLSFQIQAIRLGEGLVAFLCSIVSYCLKRKITQIQSMGYRGLCCLATYRFL